MKRKILFKVYDWELIDISTVTSKEKEYHLAGNIELASVIRHDCPTKNSWDGQKGFLDEEDHVMSRCWWCMRRAPQDVSTLWRLQNFDIIPKITISNVWNEFGLVSHKRETKRASWYKGWLDE